MSNKARKFKRVITITISGRSRGWVDEPTFAEQVVVEPIILFARTLSDKHKSLKMTVDDTAT